jgi:flagellum-specific peptidoglycan hydrolase FlgJ
MFAMKTGLINIRNGVSRFARENWFKLLLVGIALYVFFQRDLSFQVQLRSPLYPDTGEDPPAQVEQKGRREKMTQRSGKVAESPTGHRDLFDLSSAFNSPWKKDVLMEQLESVSEEQKIAYLKRFARVALTEQKKFGVPASITLANALLHSAAGTTGWSVTGNNHFALPCTENWQGQSGSYEGKCLRHFENAWASFREHSLVLSREMKEDLPFGQSSGYQNWAEALANSLYSGEKGTAKHLIALIERYKLYELDTAQ